ncbi:unnamed protein product [Lepeophtheirus salmonis]|uniref:(salmon louse) hypothetical protein n=1 Tax=Lepeophtheirus salmonis TaxID=72036 RepID=A0A7R8HEK3_LEPSM|nr:unnamed protein product [Lepeophtheirus salmonis]CAF3046523.1 unnamed protein product [Lepeophtheirus salmonis]
MQSWLDKINEYQRHVISTLQKMGRVLGLEQLEHRPKSPCFFEQGFPEKYNENKIDSPTEKRLPTQPKNHNVSPAQPSADNQAPPSLLCPEKLKRFCILNHSKTKLYLRKGNKYAITDLLPPVSSLNISLTHLTPTESPEKNFAQLILVPSQDNDKKEPDTLKNTRTIK